MIEENKFVHSKGHSKKWIRMNFNDYNQNEFSEREKAEIETERDLMKPIQQLVCDVHEETHNPNRTELQNLASAQKRMVSLMARLAISNELLTKQIVYLTWLIALMTLAIGIMSYLTLSKNL